MSGVACFGLNNHQAIKGVRKVREQATSWKVSWKSSYVQDMDKQSITSVILSTVRRMVEGALRSFSQPHEAVVVVLEIGTSPVNMISFLGLGGAEGFIISTSRICHNMIRALPKP